MIVVITGGCGLIGETFVRTLAKRGDQVVAADVNDDASHALSEEFDDAQVQYQHCDVADADEVDEMLQLTRSKWGRVHALVHCAYPRTPNWGTPFEKLAQDDVAGNLRLQLGTAIMVSQKAVKHFREQEEGHLVHISSIQGVAVPKFDHYKGQDMTSPVEYTAIRHGVVGLTQYLAKYLSDTGIRVNCISPGGIENGQPESFLDRYQNDCTSKGMLDPEDLSGVIRFLLSDQSTYVNGQNIIVDDGWSL